jgi:hypothetical protein
MLLSIRDSLDELTRGCEIDLRADGKYCVVHAKPVEDGATRCEAFVRRTVFGPADEPTKRQTEEYVRRVLGIKEGKTYRRLVERGSRNSVTS